MSAPLQGYSDLMIRELIINVKTLGVVGDGIVDDTIAISAALNSSYSTLYFPLGTYKITSEINVTTGTVKKVIGSDDTIFSFTLPLSASGIELNRNIAFENITFDYNMGNLYFGLHYVDNCGLIKLRNLKFINVKNMLTTHAPSLIQIEATGNIVDFDFLEFDNLWSVIDGISGTGGAGSVCILFTDRQAGLPLYGTISNIRITNTHSCDINGDLAVEDNAGIYLTNQNYSGKLGNVLITNVYGSEFGKYLIKILGKNVIIDDVYAYSSSMDTVAAICTVSPSGYSENIEISNVRIYGNMQWGMCIQSSNSLITNAEIDVQFITETAFNTGKPDVISILFSYALCLRDSNIIISNAILTGYRPLVFDYALENIKVSNSTLTLPSWGDVCIGLSSSSPNYFKDVVFDNVTFKSYITTTSKTVMLDTSDKFTGKPLKNGRGLKMVNCTLDCIGVNAYGMRLGYISDIDIINLTLINSSVSVYYIGIDLINCQNVRINNLHCRDRADTLVNILNCDNVLLDTLFARTVISNIAYPVNSTNVQIRNTDLYTVYKTNINDVFLSMPTTFSATANRPLVNYCGTSIFDTTLGKPIWIKSTGIKEVATLTVTTGAVTKSGNITISLDGATGITVPVTSGYTTSQVCDAIKDTMFLGWIAGGAYGTSTVIFTKTKGGVNSGSHTFTDTGTTGVVATFAVTTAGTNPIWVDKDGYIAKKNIGTTVERQAITTTDLVAGESFFDTDLSKPLYVQSISPTVWVDSGGTEVS